MSELLAELLALIGGSSGFAMAAAATSPWVRPSLLELLHAGGKCLHTESVAKV